jgi:hypothetical protein
VPHTLPSRTTAFSLPTHKPVSAPPWSKIDANDWGTSPRTPTPATLHDKFDYLVILSRTCCLLLLVLLLLLLFLILPFPLATLLRKVRVNPITSTTLQPHKLVRIKTVTTACPKREWGEEADPIGSRHLFATKQAYGQSEKEKVRVRVRVRVREREREKPASEAQAQAGAEAPHPSHIVHRTAHLAPRTSHKPLLPPASTSNQPFLVPAAA